MHLSKNHDELFEALCDHADKGSLFTDVEADIERRFAGLTIDTFVMGYGFGFPNLETVYEEMLGRCEGPLKVHGEVKDV